MTTQHTPVRLKVQHPHAGERGWEIALEPGLEQVCQDVTEANARRLAACWNACIDIDTDTLVELGPETTLVKIAIKALEKVDEALMRNAELLNRLEAAEKDAARYRWLREQHWCESEATFRLNLPEGDTVEYEYVIDKAIDAAMKEQK